MKIRARDVRLSVASKKTVVRGTDWKKRVLAE
jgi:hypothetical protein